MSDKKALLEAQELKTYFTLRGSILKRHAKQVRAVDTVSINVGSGETVAIVGEADAVRQPSQEQSCS